MLTEGLLSFDGNTPVLVPCRGTDRMEIGATVPERATLEAKHQGLKQDRGSSFLRIKGKLNPKVHTTNGRVYDAMLRLKSLSELRAVRPGDCDIGLMDPILPTIPAPTSITFKKIGDDALEGTLTTEPFKPDSLMAPGLTGWAAHLTHAFAASEAWCMSDGKKRRPGASVDWTVQDNKGETIGTTRILCANARAVVHRLSPEDKTDFKTTIDGTPITWKARRIDLGNLGNVTEYARRAFGFQRK